MVAAGLFSPDATPPEEFTSELARLSLRFLRVAAERVAPNGNAVNLKIGIHNGSLIGGVRGRGGGANSPQVHGRKLPRFRLFGDTGEGGGGYLTVC
jgi:hypothetical protein